MNHRPLHYVALASLVAMTQILSACSDSSAASSAAAGPDSQLSEPGDPVVNSDAGAANDSEMLANLLTTGVDSDDTDSYWHCSITDSEESHFVRYWADGNGYRGENVIRWQATSADSAQVTTAESASILSDIVFIDEEVAFDRFVANQGQGERIDCRWGGPSRYEDPGLQADSSYGLADLLAGDRGSRDWSCIVDQPDGSITTAVLTYGIDRTGAGEKGAFDWYFDGDLLFMVSGTGEDIEVFHDFSVVNDDATESSLAFAAHDRDASISCNSDG